MIHLNLDTLPEFTRLELLLHPPIPPALHGVNPRTVKGQEWWDLERRRAYRGNNYCCWACGVYLLDTPQGTLDAHEAYRYNYQKFEAHLVEVVALCRQCHQFIHWIRLAGNNRRAAIRILTRGLNLLYEAGLSLPRPQYNYLRQGYLGEQPSFLDSYEGSLVVKLPVEEFISKDWKLIFEGKEYIQDGDPNYISGRQ